MKITKITTYRLPPRWMFLKIETDEGVVGWGEPVIEGRARTVEAAVHELSDYLIGQDPSRINDLWQVMYRAGFYRGGPILMSAIAGIDQALWDIKGKVLNAPVWQLMGGLVRDKIKAYSWVGGDRPADVIDGIKTLREIGFDTFKLNGCEELGLIDNSRAVDAAVNTVAQIRDWEVLDALPWPEGTSGGVDRGTLLTMQDPCTARHDTAWQDAVRSLVRKAGMIPEEPPQGRDRTACCGYGGLVWCAQPELADAMAGHRAGGLPHAALSSCIMCRDRLAGSGKPGLHLLDLLPQLAPLAHGLEPEKGPGLSERRARRAALRRRLARVWLGNKVAVSEGAAGSPPF